MKVTSVVKCFDSQQTEKAPQKCKAGYLFEKITDTTDQIVVDYSYDEQFIIKSTKCFLLQRIVLLSVITPAFYNGTDMVEKKSNFKCRRPMLHINRYRCFINVPTIRKVSTVSRCLHVIATMSNMSCTWVRLFLHAVVLPFAAHLLMELMRMSSYYLLLKAQYGRKGVNLGLEFGQWGWKMS